MSKIKFNNYSHTAIVEQIAIGMELTDKNERYLELGIAKGVCVRKIAPHFRHVDAVDMAKKWYDRFMGDDKRPKNVAFYNCSTDEYFMTLHEPYDLIFIDAEHDFEQVYMDYKNAWPLLKDGGIMLFHDTYPPNEGYVIHCKDSYKIQQVLDDDEIKYVTLPFYMGVTIAIKNPEIVAHG